MAEERIIQLQDEVGDATTVEIARKLARNKRKKLTICGTCNTKSVEEFVTDLGVREMVVLACNNCGEHYGREFRKKET
jgi:RNase P subunit RPR2